MPKNPNEKPLGDREVRPDHGSKLDLKTNDIVKAFAEKKKSESPSYFEGTRSKDNIVNDFKNYIRDKYDDGVLQTLAQSGQLDAEFNQLANKGFTVADFLSEKKKDVIKDQFTGITSERQAMSKASMDCYKQRNKLSDDEKKKIPFEDFLQEVGFKIVKDQDGKIKSIDPLPKSKATSMIELKQSWDRFVRNHTTDSHSQEYASDLMSTDQFDPTEKVACIAATQGVYTKILNFGGTKTDKLLAIRDEAFPSDINQKPISAFDSRTTLEGLESCLKKFFAFVLQDNILSKDEIQNLQNIMISPRTCVNYGKKFGELKDGEYDSKLFSQLDSKVQKIANSLVTADMISNVDETMRSIDESVASFTRVFEVPGTMKGFFEQFPRDTILNTIPKEKRKEYGLLEAKNEGLRNQAEEAKNEGNMDEVKRLENEILENKKQIESFVIDDMKPSMESYIDTICDTTAQNLESLGKLNDPMMKTNLSQVLHKLYRSHRNAASLLPSEQNILMKASMAAQLSKVKNSNVMGTLGYDFETYSQFMIDLFDLENKRSVISTKDHHPIELIFSKKALVGKPYDRQTISLDDIRDLSQLRIEFEIDLKHDVDGSTEAFLKAITGGSKSQVIKNFFGTTHPVSGMPKTITDSTKVELIGKDGKKYEGYLAPACIDVPGSEHMDAYGQGTDDAKNASTYANTFVLYSSPVDQLDDTREVRILEDKTSLKEGELGTPVYINDNNLSDRDLKIIDKKATLSDKTINALALGHILAQYHDKGDLLSQKIDADMKNIEDKLGEYATIDAIDREDSNNTASTISTDNTVSESSESDLLQEGWNNIFPSGTTIPELKTGQRFALLPEQREFALGTKTVPDHRQMLAAKVKNITLDDVGKPIAFEFEIDNLTAGGSIKQKTWKVDTKSIAAFGNRNHKLFEHVHYLDDGSRSDDYKHTLSNLESTVFPKKIYPDFFWEPLNALTFDNGSFKKGAEPIVTFLSPNIAVSDDPSDKAKYPIEYHIAPKGNGKYHITSSGYAIEDPDKKDKMTLTKFDMTTDLTGLLIVLANKKLTPYTATEKKAFDADDNDVLPERRPNKLWSLSTVWEVMKDGGKKFIDAWTKKKDAAGKQELEHRLYQEYNIFRRLDGAFGGVLEFFDMNFLEDLADEAEPEAMEYGWKKIDSEYQQLIKFHHSYNVGLLNTSTSNRRGANSLCRDHLEKAMESYENNNGKVPYKQRYRTAAALMYMVEKYKDGYARELRIYPKGTYVKLLLGAQAHAVFIERYNEKKRELENSKTGNAVQEILMTMEYNFIVGQLAGSPQQDPRVRDQDRDGSKGGTNTETNPNAWYYQRVYSRKFGNELRKHVGNIKGMDPTINNEDAKKNIATGAYEHMKAEYYDHIAQYRMDDAIAELVAMQQLATTSDQANEVLFAVMMGMMNGAFVHRMGNDTRDKFRAFCRNSAIPFPNWMEHHDAGHKIARLLKMCTADLGDQSFDNFTYKNEKAPGGKEKYDFNDFDPFQTLDKRTEGFKFAFKKWTSPDTSHGRKVRDRVVEFVFMDNIMDDDDNNLMAIRKRKKEIQNGDCKVYDRKIDEGDREIVDSMFGEFYFNKDRGTDINSYNRAYWYGKQGAHTRTMIEPVFSTMLNKTDGGSFQQGVGDHAEGLWSSIITRIPDNKVSPTQRYKLSYYLDEFFRVFGGIGDMKYSEDNIARFYRNIIYLKEHGSTLSSWDKKRLLWFYPLQQVYAGGSVPTIVENALQKYMQFFETNLDLLDKDTASLHLVPGAGAGAKDFGYIFEREWNDAYIPDDQRKKMEDTQKRKLQNNAKIEDRYLMNAIYMDANSKASGNDNRSQHPVGMSIDDKIEIFSGKSSGGSSGQGGIKKKSSDLKSEINATNNALVDRSKIEKSDNMFVDKNGNLIDKKELTPEEKKAKEEKEQRIKEMKEIADQQYYANNQGY